MSNAMLRIVLKPAITAAFVVVSAVAQAGLQEGVDAYDSGN